MKRSLIALGVLAFSLGLWAESSPFLVIDSVKVMRDAKAAKKLAEALEKKAEEFEKTKAKDLDGFKTEEKSLMDQKDKLSEAELRSKVEAFEKKVNDYLTKDQEKQKVIFEDFAKQQAKVRDVLVKIIESLRTQRGAKIVISRSAAEVYDVSLDITDKALEQIDRIYPEVK